MLMFRPVAGVDIGVARNILAYNMKRYPDGGPFGCGEADDPGVFFLYFQARLHTSMCEPELANSECASAVSLTQQKACRERSTSSSSTYNCNTCVW
jgi:hypothetical protein